MNAHDRSNKTSSRRKFFQQSGRLAAGAALAGALSTRAYAGEQNTIKIALVGCGGRGTGAAAQALSTQGPTKLWAMADFFDARLQPSLRLLAGQFAKQVDVPKERQFVGLDAYKKAIDVLGPGGVVLLTTPPAFRPIHLEYAVAQGCHVFMEKSFAVDAPGVRRVLKAGQEAGKKNLKIAGGLMSRHYRPLEEAVAQLHNGLVGEIIALWSYREHGAVGFSPKPAGMCELAHQIRNYSNFTWLNGSFLLDWLIHDIDVCCWIKDAWPISAQGQGGRQVRTAPDQLFDHYAVEYSFADGTRMFLQGRHIDGCWGFCGNVIQGARGSAVGNGWGQSPAVYKGHKRSRQDLIWEYKGPECNDYQAEHDLLFDAIRTNKPYNEAQRCAKAAMAGIIGRMAAESGQEITWDQAMASQIELAPGLDKYTLDSPAPVLPDAQGHYPIAMPGITKVL
ncbi:MAG: gfo/Idh/MocA family oxidoreductase [Thermoguttaceae bacterium]|jgi:predicted dehydrogenase